MLPLFLGPSLAIIDYLPEIVEELRVECSDLQVMFARPLAGENVEDPDPRLAEMVAGNIREQLEEVHQLILHWWITGLQYVQ